MSVHSPLKAPFPYFGGKSRIASEVWKRFGDIGNYVEPFFGSGSVLLRRPSPFHGREIVNDLDGFVANFWRSVQKDPDAVARHVDWPANENDYHARKSWLLRHRAELSRRLEGDPEYHDPMIAGWWCWCMAVEAGSDMSYTDGPWRVVDGKFVRLPDRHSRGRNGDDIATEGASRDCGPGIHRSRIRDCESGIHGRMVRRLARLDHEVLERNLGILEWMRVLTSRLRDVRVFSGDWSRVVSSAIVPYRHRVTAVFLDPPYNGAVLYHKRPLYAEGNDQVSSAVRRWCVENGDNPLLRIALCGYEGEHDMPASWLCVAWSASGGYRNLARRRGERGPRNENRHRERVWFSPHCLEPEFSSTNNSQLRFSLMVE